MSIIKNELDKFIHDWNGKALDVDGFPPSQPFQCVDVIKKFDRDYLGLKIYSFSGRHSDLDRAGGAWSSGKYFFERGENRHLSPYDTQSSKYGEYRLEIINHPMELEYGDRVYFYPTKGNPYGHIGYFIENFGGKIKTFNQNYSSKYCKFDSIPHNQFAKGLRVVFASEDQNINYLTMSERQNSINVINRFSEMFRDPKKHISHIENKKSDQVIFDLTYNLNEARVNQELKNKLKESIKNSNSLNKAQHYRNISMGNGGISQSYQDLVDQIDYLRREIENYKQEKENALKEGATSIASLKPETTKKDLNITNVKEDVIETIVNNPKKLQDLISILTDLSKKK